MPPEKQPPEGTTFDASPTTPPSDVPTESPTKKQKRAPSTLVITPTKTVSLHAQPSFTTQAKTVNHFTAASSLIDEILGKYDENYTHQHRQRDSGPSNRAPLRVHYSDIVSNNRKLPVNTVIDRNHRFTETCHHPKYHPKYHPNSHSKCNHKVKTAPIVLPPIPHGPPRMKPTTEAKSWNIVTAIKTLLHSASPLVKPALVFKVSPQAAEYNFHMLRGHNFDLNKLLNDMSDGTSVTSYGSEFKAPSELSNLLQRHPRWQALSKLLKEGSSWPLQSIPEAQRSKDLEAALARGNHKTADQHGSFLATALSKEVVKGWELILPAARAKELPGLVVSPMGVAEHIGIQADGTFAPKARLTHDLSFPGFTSEESINSRVIEDNLEPCMFGHALLRIIHRIVHLRTMYPNTIIWIRKEDAKSAYRRVHLNASMAFKSAVQLEIEKINYILLSLRLPFGGSPCPSEFCLISDIMNDTRNDLLACPQWNPIETRSNYVTKIPPPTRLPTEIPFARAKETSVPNLEGGKCSADVFIDDIITVGVDIGDNLERITAGPCTVMHAIAHKNSAKHIVPRQDFIADDKNDAEGAAEEEKVVLGWSLNTRTLDIKLPYHKYKAWSSQLRSFILRQSTNAKDIQSLLGRLENIAIIIPMFGHFLNNIRHTEIMATQSGRNQKINRRTHEDLKLAQKYLDKAHVGVSMNLMTFRSPNRIYINDASEHGLGGFSTHGRAWAWTIPEPLRGRAHINLLEFLAQLVSIWIDIREDVVQPQDCLLGMGDNTASMGWLRRANFRESDENNLEWFAKQKVARQLASLILQSNTVLYRQWFRGADNDVADSLSRDSFFLTHSSHERFLRQTLPHQVPQHFSIQQVPKEIISFITSTLLLLPVKKQRLLPQKPSEVALGNVGLISSFKLVSPHSISSLFVNSNKISSFQPLPKRSGKQPSLEEIKRNWWRAQSMPPSHMWHRPSGQTTGLTPDWTKMARRVSSSKSKCVGTETRTDQDRNRKPYPCQS